MSYSLEPCGSWGDRIHSNTTEEQGSLPEVLRPPEKELVARLLKELRKGGVPMNQEGGQTEQPQELEHELPYGS